MTGRAGRAAILAAAAVVLGIAAHGETGADGWAVAASPVTASLVAVIAAATGVVALRPPSLPRVGLLLGGAQLALHLALGVGVPMDQMATMGPQPMIDPPMTGLPMILGHLLVTALVTAGVVGADRALLTAGHRGAAVLAAVVAQTARLRLGRTTPPAPPAPLTTARPRPAPILRPATVLVTRSHPRRGPPRTRPLSGALALPSV